MLPEVEEVKDTKDVQDEKGEVIKPNIFDIELLQRKYENNIVSLDELTDEELDMLNDLYVSQIEKLRVIKQDKENQLTEIENKINKKKAVV
jgi:hypothetical protein